MENRFPILSQWRFLPQPLRFSLGALSALYVVHFGLLAFLVGPFDYNHLSTYYELAWKFWKESPGLPHYNPFFCGGRTLGGDPQIPVFHPIIVPLVALLGSVWTVKWEMLAQLAVGFWGLGHWFKRWEIDRNGRAWGYVLFGAGGFTVAKFLVGHVTLGFYFLLPCYFFLSYRLCESRGRTRDRQALLLCLLFLYCTLYKPNFLIYALPTLAFEAVCRSVLGRSWKPLLVLGAATTAAGLACAATLLPASDYFKHFPRAFDAGSKTVPISALIANLFLPLKAIPASFYGPDFMQRHEYNVFLGPVALFFAYLGIHRLRHRHVEMVSLLLFALFCAVLGLGDPVNESPWVQPLFPFHWLKGGWPGFESIRVPVRFWFGTYLALIVLSAAGFSWPSTRSKQTLIFLFGLLPLLAHATINLSKVTWFSTQTQWFPKSKVEAQFTHHHADPDRPYDSIRRGEGVLECVENVEAFHVASLQEGFLLASEPRPGIEVKADWLSWNRFRIRGSAQGLQRLALNLNHHPYWQVEGEHMDRVSQAREPLTFQVGPGEFLGEVTFRQPRLAFGLELSLVALGILGVWISLLRRRASRPWRIGLTGGIASGKSTVAHLLRRRGWVVVDLDAEARRLTGSDPQVQAEIRRLFGNAVFDEGVLNRGRLRNAVFNDSNKRVALEKLLHPMLMAAFEARFRQAARAGVRAVVCEAALLFETGHYAKFDSLIVVVAPEDQRRARLSKRDGATDAQIDLILKTQTSDEQKVRVAHFVVRNGGDLVALEKELETLIPPL